jgi:hypothetical protein
VSPSADDEIEEFAAYFANSGRACVVAGFCSGETYWREEKWVLVKRASSISLNLRAAIVLLLSCSLLVAQIPVCLAANPTIQDVGITFESTSVPEYGPKSASIGGHLRLWYYINNPTSSAINVWLGASIKDSKGNPDISDPPNDYYTALDPGVRWYSRYFYIPSNAILDTYDVGYGVHSADNSQMYSLVWKAGWLIITNLVSLYLSSATTDGISNPSGGTITFDGSSYTLPTTIYVATKTYSAGAHATAPPGYVVDHWETSGSVSYLDQGNGYANVYIKGPGGLKVYFLRTATFDLSANPSALTVVQGNSVQSTVTLTSRNGFSGTVSLYCIWPNTIPSWVTRSDFSQSQVYVPNGGSATSILTISVSSSAAVGGPYPLTIVTEATNQPAKTYDLRLTVAPFTDTWVVIAAVTLQSNTFRLQQKGGTSDINDWIVSRTILPAEVESKKEYLYVAPTGRQLRVLDSAQNPVTDMNTIRKIVRSFEMSLVQQDVYSYVMSSVTKKFHDSHADLQIYLTNFPWIWEKMLVEANMWNDRIDAQVLASLNAYEPYESLTTTLQVALQILGLDSVAPSLTDNAIRLATVVLIEKNRLNLLNSIIGILESNSFIEVGGLSKADLVLRLKNVAKWHSDLISGIVGNALALIQDSMWNELKEAGIQIAGRFLQILLEKMMEHNLLSGTAATAISKFLAWYGIAKAVLDLVANPSAVYDAVQNCKACWYVAHYLGQVETYLSNRLVGQSNRLSGLNYDDTELRFLVMSMQLKLFSQYQASAYSIKQNSPVIQIVSAIQAWLGQEDGEGIRKDSEWGEAAAENLASSSTELISNLAVNQIVGSPKPIVSLQTPSISDIRVGSIIQLTVTLQNTGSADSHLDTRQQPWDTGVHVRVQGGLFVKADLGGFSTVYWENPNPVSVLSTDPAAAPDNVRIVELTVSKLSVGSLISTTLYVRVKSCQFVIDYRGWMRDASRTVTFTYNGAQYTKLIVYRDPIDSSIINDEYDGTPLFLQYRSYTLRLALAEPIIISPSNVLDLGSASPGQSTGEARFSIQSIETVSNLVVRSSRLTTDAVSGGASYIDSSNVMLTQSHWDTVPKGSTVEVRMWVSIPAGASAGSYSGVLTISSDYGGSTEVLVSLLSAASNTRTIRVYSLLMSYFGQDPESVKPNDIKASVKADYTYQGQSQTKTSNTVFDVTADVGSSITFTVTSVPSDYVFANKWDHYGYAQHSIATLTIQVVSGSAFDKVAAFFSARVGAFDFSLSPSGGITVIQGGSGSNTITVTLTSGSTQSVSLATFGLPNSTSGPPSGATVSHSPSNTGNPTFDVQLTITVPSNIPTGSYTITVRGTGGGLTRSTTFTLTVNPSSVTTEKNMWFDNFESYALGTFPGPGSAGPWELVYNGAGTQYQVVSNAYHVSGTKALQLRGTTNWAAVATRNLDWADRIGDKRIGYEFSILIESQGPMGGPGTGDWCAFFNKNVGTWGKGWAIVTFGHTDHSIRAEDGTLLGSWQIQTWYKVKVVLDRNTNTYSVWINGVLKGQGLPLSSPQDSNLIVSLRLDSDHPGANVYYDDVRVFVVTDLDDGKLFRLPAGAVMPDDTVLTNYGLLTSVNNQMVTASPGQQISLTVNYQKWAPTNPSEIDQLFLIASWTRSWPPSSGYYYPIYNGMPGLYPGATRSATVSVTVPSTPGVYYLWFCTCAHYSMQQAVATYTTPLTLPANIRIVVSGVTPVPPSLTLFSPQISALTVTINGVTMPGSQGTTISRIHWDWGDGNSEDHWFPASHTYAGGGTYTISVTSHQSDGLSTSSSVKVVPQSRPSITVPPSSLAYNPLKRVFFIFNNKKYYITNMDAFSSYGLNWANVKNYTQMNPDSYPNSQINYDYLLDRKMPLPNRPYVAGDVSDGSLYYIPYYTWNGQKYPISWAGYNAYGGYLKTLPIRYGDPALSLPDSAKALNGTNPIPTVTPPGYVIAKNPLNRVFFIFNTKKYYFTDWPIYLAYGFTNSNINATVNPDTYPNAQVRFDYLLEDLSSVFRKPLPNQPYIVGDINDGSLYWVAYFTYTGEKYAINWPGYNAYGGQLKTMHTRYGDPSILLPTSAYVLDGVNPLPLVT